MARPEVNCDRLQIRNPMRRDYKSRRTACLLDKKSEGTIYLLSPILLCKSRRFFWFRRQYEQYRQFIDVDKTKQIVKMKLLFSLSVLSSQKVISII